MQLFFAMSDLVGVNSGPPRVLHIMCRINKRYIFLALVLSAAVLYLSYSLSYCVIIDLGLNPTKNQGLSGQIKAALQRPCIVQSQQHPVVPVWNSRFPQPVPHTGSTLQTITETRYKYRVLAQQGLVPVRRLPDVIIIGVKKGGTRALLEFIRIHPNVRAVGLEVHFFDHHYDKGLSWYRNQMPPTLDGQLTMEKTPSYFVTRDTPRRVYEMNPNTLLLIVVRDPVTRAISDYTQAATKSKHILRFEDLAFLNSSNSMVDTTWGPIKIGVYARHLERWLRYFPLKQFLFVSGEKLVVDPAFEMARVQNFLGLKRVITERHFYFNTSKGFPCLLKSEVKSSPHCLGRTKGREHPIVQSAILERLRDFYRPFNNKFYRLTGMDFGWP